MTYHVNEIFKTVQGEGYWTGRAAVFCRFSRCNLWTGHEKDRHRAVCKFCDTDFTDATKYDLQQLVDQIEKTWGDDKDQRMVVFTGGEPALQLDNYILTMCQTRGFYTAIETNGTLPLPSQLQWVCVSPKANAELVVHKGDELKLVYPQGPDPGVYLGLKFKHYWLSPMDLRDLDDIEEAELMTKENIAAAVDYVLNHPKWRLSIQTHKMIGVR